jgi:hypothetical protein
MESPPRAGDALTPGGTRRLEVLVEGCLSRQRSHPVRHVRRPSNRKVRSEAENPDVFELIRRVIGATDDRARGAREQRDRAHNRSNQSIAMHKGERVFPATCLRPLLVRLGATRRGAERQRFNRFPLAVTKRAPSMVRNGQERPRPSYESERSPRGLYLVRRDMRRLEPLSTVMMRLRTADIGG